MIHDGPLNINLVISNVVGILYYCIISSRKQHTDNHKNYNNIEIIYILPAVCEIQSLHIMPKYFIKYQLILGKLFKKIILVYEVPRHYIYFLDIL